MRKKESFKEKRLIFDRLPDYNPYELQNPANRENEPGGSGDRREAQEAAAENLTNHEFRAKKASELLNSYNGDLNKLNDTTLDAVVMFALISSATDSLIYRTVKNNLNSASLNRIPVPTIASILAKSQKNDQELYKKILSQLNLKKKEELYADTSVSEEIKNDIEFNDKDSFQEGTNNEKIRAAGISIKKGQAVFMVEGTSRSFVYSGNTRREIEAELQNAQSADEIRLVFYQALLRIITKDGSIRTNKYKLKNFQASNAALIAEINRLETQKNNDGEKLNPQQQVAVRRKTNTDLAEIYFGAREKIADGYTTAEKIYRDWERTYRWTDKTRPFTAKEFYKFNGGSANKPNGRLALPFIKERASERNRKNTLERSLQIQIITDNQYSFDDLTAEQEGTFTKTIQKIRQIVEKGTDLPSIVLQLEDAAQKAYPILKKSAIDKTKIKIGDETITWDLNLPHGNFAESQKAIYMFKADKAGVETDKLDKFLERGKRTETEIKTREAIKDENRRKQYEYDRVYQELTEKEFIVNPDQDIAENWTAFHGHREVNRLMQSYPFNLPDEITVRATAEKIINEGFDSIVEFSDIFDQMNGFPAVNKDTVPAEFLKNSADFLTEFNRLKNTTDLNTKETRQLKAMHEIMARCLDLLYAFSNLRQKEEREETVEEAQPLSDIVREEQEEIYEALAELTEYDIDSSNAWHEFYSWAFEGRHKTNITMADIDGNTFTVAQGAFKDRYDAKAAQQIISNSRENYYLDEEGRRILNKRSIFSFINERIELGALNLALAEANTNDTNNIRGNLAIQLNKLYVTDLTDISDEQKEAFQLGFIIAEARKNSTDFKKAKEITGANQEIAAKNPLFQQLVERLENENVSPEDIQKIDQALLAAGGIVIDTRTGSIRGFGAGADIIKIPGTDITISIFGGIFDKGLIVGGKLKIEIAKVSVFADTDTKISVEIPLSIAGIGVGISAETEVGEYIVDPFVGVHWSWDSIIPTVGGGLLVSVNAQKRLEKNVGEALASGNLKDIWREWKNIPKNDIEDKYNKLKQLPQIYAKLRPLEEAFKLTHEDIVLIATSVQDKIKDQAFKDTSSLLFEPIPLISHLGFIMVGPMPIPAVGIEILDAEISVPNRSEIGRLTQESSNIRLNHKLQEALTTLESRSNRLTLDFIDQTPQLIYSRDGQILSLVNKYEINLDSWLTTPESYNQALKQAEIQLIELPSGAVELRVLNTADKDTEIYIDPELQSLAVIRDGQHIFLEGNVDDLIIARERFTLPFAPAGEASSVRDIITVRQKTSVEGDRDSSYMQHYSPKFLQKLAHEYGFEVYDNNRFKKNTNLLEIAGFSTSEVQSYLKARKAKPGQMLYREFGAENAERLDRVYQQIATFVKARPNFESKISRGDIREMEELFRDRIDTIGSLDKSDYQNYQDIRPDLLNEIRILFFQNHEFHREFSRIADQPEKIVRLLKEYSENVEGLRNLNDAETNLAVIHLLNLWYTNVYTDSAKTEKLEETNRNLLAAIEKHMNFVRDQALIPAFRSAIARMEPKPTITATRAAEILASDTTGKLREMIKKNPKTFNYTQLKTTNLPRDSYFFSGSRLGEGSARQGTLTYTINYQQVERDTSLVHDLGFLRNTIKRYDINSKNREEREMARLLLEVASPIPASDREFLNSPLARKIAGLKSHLLLSFNEKTRFGDYKMISDIYHSPEILRSSSQHRAAFNRFKDLVGEIREAQINNRTFEKKIGDTGLTIRLHMVTELAGGAYSKCANPSFLVAEKGFVHILKDNKVIAQFEMSNEVIDTNLSKLFRSFGVGIGITTSEAAAPKFQGQHKGTSQTRVSTGETPDQIISRDYE